MGSVRSKRASNNTSDPTALLARGYTARFLGPSAKPLTALSNDEIEKDLRHFQAYRQAVLSYRQQYYLAVNRITQPEPEAPVPQLASLPVRIDPEEEKRLMLLRKKIARAEFHREEAEQRYVALRAHYVQVSQDLQTSTQQREKVLGFLQETIQQRAAAVGLLRARLQMTRDVLSLLQRRGQVLEQANVNVGNINVSTTEEDQLTVVWNQVEEELKKISGKTAKKKKPMQWPCTKQPATPFGVPLLLSALSTAPEKSIAFGVNRAFESKPHSLCWLEDHLPESEEIEDDADEVKALREEVEFLQSELSKERLENEQLSHQIATVRCKNDEHIAMMCLIRQETESVLHRHNILLESEPAMKAAEKFHQRALEERAAAVMEKEQQGSPEQELEPIEKEDGSKDTLTVTRNADDANDGDDEDSNNDDEEEVGDWTGNKRAAEEEEGGTSKKRRKL